MAGQPFAFWAIYQILENRTQLGEALFFPEVTRYAAKRERLAETLERNVQELTEHTPLADLHRRRGPRSVQVRPVTVVLDPPPCSATWQSPVTLHLHAVCWSHGDEAHLAYVPALGIEVAAARPEDLDALIVKHARAALMRTKAAVSLERLTSLERRRSVQAEALTVAVTIRSPKEIARAEEENRDEKKAVLDQVATNLTGVTHRPAYAMEDVVSLLAEMLTARQPRSVVLVGPSGVGKTAAVHELVRRRHDLGLGATPFWATSGARLVAGMTGYGMWQERCRQVWQEAAKQKAVLHLGNLVELMEVGKSEHQPTGIAHFLRPYIARGDLLVITECTPEQIPVIERQDPHLLDVLQQIPVPEPSAERGRDILRRFAWAAHPGGSTYLDPAALETLDRLHRRYATYSAYPGRPLRFLTNLLHDRPEGQMLTPAEVVAAFARETGLPRFLLDDAVPLDRAATRDWFARRVIGQAEAVDLVVDLLTTVKAGLNRPRKPIASLLFIGPTGVGKTEMAKSLAEFLFGDKNRLTRLDMSEFADPNAVQRLIGGGYGSEGILTARVREQPFAVVLLDEVEKAHPLFFDLLLQVLGEGRLTDAAGRLADFCNSVVIMTSNLGAETFQQGAFGLVNDLTTRGRAREHFEQEVRRFVRPELFNRIDRIVAFAPLDEATVLAIAERQLDLLQVRDGVRYRGVKLSVAPEVSRHLTRKGYDVRYGARPLKRALERELLAPLADRMNRYAAETALAVDVRLADEALAMTVRARVDAGGRQVFAAWGGQQAVPAETTPADMARDCTGLRRLGQALQQSPATLELDNDIYRLERLEKRLARRRYRAPEAQKRLAELTELRKLAATLTTLFTELANLEDEALLALYGKAPFEPVRLMAALAKLSGQWSEALLALYCRRFANPDAVTVAIFSEDLEGLFELARAYVAVAEGRGCRVALYPYLPWRADANPPGPAEQRQILCLDGPQQGWQDWQAGLIGPLVRHAVARPAIYLLNPEPGVIGLGLGLRGPAVFPRFDSERGLHEFVSARKTIRCLVQTSEAPLSEYQPPEGIERRGAIGSQDRRRLYDANTDTALDLHLKTKYAGTLTAILTQALEDRLQADARGLLES